jgi:cell division protein FtsB
MPWYCVPCKFQRHAKQQEGRIRHLEQELKIAREEICKLKAGNICSNYIEESAGSWKKPKKVQVPQVVC